MMGVCNVSSGARAMVAEIIEAKKDEIAALCREYHVRSLWIFGSATTDRFNPETSDIDLLVDLGEYDDDVARRYFRLRRELVELTGFDVDLVSIGGLHKNPVRDEILNSRIRVYDARM